MMHHHPMMMIIIIIVIIIITMTQRTWDDDVTARADMRTGAEGGGPTPCTTQSST
jgi:hypothetical protein